MNKSISIIAAGMMALSAVPTIARERLIIVNEGLWQSDNGKLSYFEDGEVVSNQWFRDCNGAKLGDTPNDIILVNDSLIAISVNWSNIIQFISPDGKAVAATEDVPNNRCLATDGEYVYVTSYGHECGSEKGMLTFDKGYVAKIDVATFKVVDAVEVGYEPEGIALYDGHLFVANSGGYAFQEDHEYETTVSVIDAATMETTRTVDTGQINLYGKLSRTGQYLSISSPGDYYDTAAATIIMDCEAVLAGAPDEECFVKLGCAATYSCTAADGRFFAVGARYSYYSGEYEFNYLTIAPEEVMASGGSAGIYEEMPGTLAADLKALTMPYGIYVNPYSGYIYATDAGSFAAAGELHQWSPEGEHIGSHKVYINPGHFLALPDAPEPPEEPEEPEDPYEGVEAITGDAVSPAAPLYDLRGFRVTKPQKGEIYIYKGKKFIFK